MARIRIDQNKDGITYDVVINSDMDIIQMFGLDEVVIESRILRKMFDDFDKAEFKPGILEEMGRRGIK